jgi:hypothetical protein
VAIAGLEHDPKPDEESQTDEEANEQTDHSDTSSEMKSSERAAAHALDRALFPRRARHAIAERRERAAGALQVATDGPVTVALQSARWWVARVAFCNLREAPNESGRA